jgi:hypothetical protein
MHRCHRQGEVRRCMPTQTSVTADLQPQLYGLKARRCFHRPCSRRVHRWWPPARRMRQRLRRRRGCEWVARGVTGAPNRGDRAEGADRARDRASSAAAGRPACRFSFPVTCRSCLTCAFPRCLTLCEHDQSQNRGESSRTCAAPPLRVGQADSGCACRRSSASTRCMTSSWAGL